MIISRYQLAFGRDYIYVFYSVMMGILECRYSLLYGQRFQVNRMSDMAPISCRATERSCLLFATAPFRNDVLHRLPGPRQYCRRGHLRRPGLGATVKKCVDAAEG